MSDYHLCVTVEPRFNEPLFNEVLDIMNDTLCPGQSYRKMYGTEPRYNEHNPEAQRQQRNSFHTGELSYSPIIGETQIANVNFKLISLNARGIRDFQKRKAIFSWIKKQNADIAFLQETYSTPEIVDEWKFQWTYSRTKI